MLGGGIRSAAAHLRVAVIGAGPAGLYCASNVIKRVGCAAPPIQAAADDGGDDGGHHPRERVRVAVDIIDARPVPGGLARYGVAPDHAPLIAPVLKTFDALLERPEVRFFGNVRVRTQADAASGVGGDLVTLDELRAMYDGVILAHGAERAHALGIPGEHLALSARQFVAWYCGDPVAPPLSLPGSPPPDAIEDVVIVGAGNVSLDVARMLLSPPEVLAEETDVAKRFLDFRARHLPGLRRVHVLARRGPRAAAFAPKELREILAKPHFTKRITLPEGIPYEPLDADASQTDGTREGATFPHPFATNGHGTPTARASKRVFKMLRDHFLRQADQKDAPKELVLHFLVSHIPPNLPSISSLLYPSLPFPSFPSLSFCFLSSFITHTHTRTHARTHTHTHTQACACRD